MIKKKGRICNKKWRSGGCTRKGNHGNDDDDDDDNDDEDEDEDKDDDNDDGDDDDEDDDFRRQPIIKTVMKLKQFSNNGNNGKTKTIKKQ